MASDSTVTVWISGVKAGDEQATRKLWDRYYRRLVALAAKRLPCHARRDTDEEDVALSAFHSFYDRAARGQFPRVAGRDDLWRLLAAITARKVVSVLRHRARRKRGSGNVVGESGVVHSAKGSEGGLSRIVGRDLSPELAAQLDEDYRLLLGALGDETLRTVAHMKVDGHSHGEIAKRLGVSARTVERKLRLIREICEQHALDQA